MGIPKAGLTIERVDNSKGYEPGNCRWDTSSNQCVNRRKFRNNTTGVRGVVEVETGYEARFDYEHRRYYLGKYPTLEKAAEARRRFVDGFFRDRDAALKALDERVPDVNTKTKVRGVTQHVDGGYIVRCTVAGVRRYVGYFRTLEEATDARTRFLAR